MNKVLVGGLVVLVGIAVGWYVVSGSKEKLPGMQIGTTQNTPGPSSVESADVTITDESTITGTGKGSIPTEAGVTYSDSGYSPKEITIKKGTTVTFTNSSSRGMWTASDAHPTHQILPGFDQKKSVVSGGTYEYIFAKVGRWQYHNHVYPTHGGVVVVVE